MLRVSGYLARVQRLGQELQVVRFMGLGFKA